MSAVYIVWLLVSVLIASLSGHLLVRNELPCLRTFLDRTIGRGGVLGLSIVSFVGCAIVLAACTSIGIAVVLMSLVAFAGTAFSYFIFQRFAAPLDKPGVARDAPSVLPSVCFYCFVSSVLSLLAFAAWYWTILPVLVWLSVGFAAAEYMIRREMARGADRRLATFSVNDAQGTRGWFDMDRYPFP